MKSKLFTLALLTALSSAVLAQHAAVGKNHDSSPHDHTDHTPRVHDRTTTVRSGR